MRSLVAVLLLSGPLAPCTLAQGDSYLLQGYVTRAASNSDFDVNGAHIVCSDVTRGSIVTTTGIRQSAAACQGGAPFIGERLDVYGAQFRKPWPIPDQNSGTMGKVEYIHATRIENHPLRPYEISGSAVIDAQPAPQTGSGQTDDYLVRADGYWIRIDRKTKTEWKQPLQSFADLKAGDWIQYKGKLNAAGVLVAASVHIGPDTISDGEQKLRAKDEYDPTTVSPEARQNFLVDGLKGGCSGAYIEGCDPRKFAWFNDPEMQARIEEIGNKLGPDYQRALPANDPAKIDFRFRLIDTKLVRDTFSLSSGIILVPHQVVERMQNDSQLAAILADGIARVLEKQQYRTEGKIRTATASGLAVAFVPYSSYGALAGFQAAGSIREKAMEQRDRVSLVLLHDAGYDIDQAPLAWWLLDPGKQKPLSEIDMPDRAAYLYRILGESWHNPTSTAQTR